MIFTNGKRNNHFFIQHISTYLIKLYALHGCYVHGIIHNDAHKYSMHFIALGLN
jgi:hypothetical protein